MVSSVSDVPEQLPVGPVASRQTTDDAAPSTSWGRGSAVVEGWAT